MSGEHVLKNAMSASTDDNQMVHSSPVEFTDGTITMKVMGEASNAPMYTGGALVRWQDANNFYLVQAAGDRVYLLKRVNGTWTGSFGEDLPSAIVGGTWYTLKVVAEGNKLSVYWNDQYMVSWEDPSPWYSGKVGFRNAHLASSANTLQVYWDDVTVTTGGPGTVITAEDFDPWGVVLEGRSYVASNADDRYKFTGKERDKETDYDYFGARYYDSRIGRWMSVDPSAATDPNRSPFTYCGDNPVINVDPDGRIFDTILDIAFVAYDVYDIAKSVINGEGVSAAQGLALGADVACAILPIATGGGAAIRGAAAAEHAIGEAAKVDKVADAIKVAGKVEDGAKGAEKATEVTKAVHGNSASSTKAQHNYDIVDTWTNKVVKTGTSGGKETRAGESYRGKSQANKWNKEEKTPGRYKTVTTNRTPEGTPRSVALDYERNRANQLRDQLDPRKHKRP